MNGEEESVALFSHWRGQEFLNEVKNYLTELNIGRPQSSQIDPLDRREPDTLMIDFIRWLTKDMDCVEGDLYLGKDGDDGDNSDNGHFRINAKTGEYS